MESGVMFLILKLCYNEGIGIPENIGGYNSSTRE